MLRQPPNRPALLSTAGAALTRLVPTGSPLRRGAAVATALVATLDARHRYTAGHAAAVAIYTCVIAQPVEVGER